MTITLGHGAGGRLSHQLVADHFLPKLGNAALAELTDAATVGDLAVTTDGYVVTPRFFPGGDIGKLSVAGTINDLAMVGAEPIALTAAFVIEEGFGLDELDRIVDSMAETAKAAAVPIVAGDTKVVARGACDGLFITTAGMGRLLPGFRPAPSRVVVGDALLVSGAIAEHGMAVMGARPGLGLAGGLESDVAPLHELVRALRLAGIDVHALRDPTRGGVAQSALELATASRTRVVLEERAIPLRAAVAAACELLGIDPLHVANEGKLLAFVPAAEAERALALLRSHRLGRDAAAIGRVEPGEPGVEVETSLGARRVLRMPLGELLPRIC